jgi:epoxyqueuosine reductase
LEFRAAIGDRLYGCDECLDVCPWNRWAVPQAEAKFTARELPSLSEMLQWSEATFTARMQGSPLRRLKLRRLKRNICVVLGNVGTFQDLQALRFIATGTDALLAEHARWAIQAIEQRSDA